MSEKGYEERSCGDEVILVEDFTAEELKILFDITGEVALPIGSEQHAKVMRIRTKIAQKFEGKKNSPCCS